MHNTNLVSSDSGKRQTDKKQCSTLKLSLLNIFNCSVICTNGLGKTRTFILHKNKNDKKHILRNAIFMKWWVF